MLDKLRYVYKKEGLLNLLMVALSHNSYSLLRQVINQYFQNKLIEQQYHKIMESLGVQK